MSVIRPLDFDELDAELTELLRPRVERLGYLGDFFRYAAHQPRALVHFHGFTEELKHALDHRHTELVALTVSSALGCRYERHQHEQLARRLGMSDLWIRTAVRGQADDQVFGADELAVQSLATACVTRSGQAAALSALLEHVEPREAVGVLMLCGRYIAHGTIAAALELTPPVPSVLEDDRER